MKCIQLKCCIRPAIKLLSKQKINMIASDYSSDDSMSMPSPVPTLTNDSRSNDFKKDANERTLDSILKRAIKESESSIIQSILSPTTLPPLALPKANGSDISDESGDSNSVTSGKTSTETPSEGLSPLLDYLFEDGQLTRIEYDMVDKGYGANSATEQVQVLLKILESKDDGALESLLERLRTQNASSETIHKLCERFLPGSRKNTKDMGFRDNHSSKKRHDFYYGRRQILQSHYSYNRRKECSGFDEQNRETNGTHTFDDGRTSTRQQMNKTKTPLDLTDFRDFYLTNGCLDTIRNLILDNCKESITALGWEKVLRNMNGLLSTDVLSIKDLLFQIKTMDHQRALEAETREANVMRKIHRERRKLRQLNSHGKEKRMNADSGESENDHNDVALRRYDDDNDVEVGTAQKKSKNKRCEVNWNQVIYHSFQVWKQRNGLNSTFYSLIGIFQHSNLCRTADLLLECKKEIQLRENEKDITRGGVTDVNNGSGASTMLEKSDFLRKFYSPSRRGDSSSHLNSVGLITTKDRVSASPVLSLDLL